MKKTVLWFMIFIMVFPALCLAEEHAVSVYPCDETQACTEFIRLDDKADCFCLKMNGELHSIVLEEIVPEEEITYTRVFWTIDRLSGDSSIIIKAYQGEVFPRFRITCLNGKNELERYYVTESGEDGSLFLITEAQDPDFITHPGLRDAEDETEYLTGFLTREVHTQKEKNDAAQSYYEVWDGLRISAWGGYAQSFAEQNWLQNAEENARQAAAPYEAYTNWAQVYFMSLGEQTRLHVLALWGIGDTAPAEEMK